jgi:hypothetical protein
MGLETKFRYGAFGELLPKFRIMLRILNGNILNGLIERRGILKYGDRATHASSLRVEAASAESTEYDTKI